MKALIRIAGCLIAALGVGGIVYGWISAGVPQTAEHWVSCVLVHIVAVTFVVLGAIIWLEADA